MPPSLHPHFRDCIRSRISIARSLRRNTGKALKSLPHFVATAITRLYGQEIMAKGVCGIRPLGTLRNHWTILEFNKCTWVQSNGLFGSKMLTLRPGHFLVNEYVLSASSNLRKSFTRLLVSFSFPAV